MDAAEPSIVVDGLRVIRGGEVVLDGLSVTVEAGRVTGLLGPSGSGKSTLIRSIVGVQKTHGGRVHVLGRSAGTPALRSRVAYVTQAPSVYLDLTVAENLRYFASVLGVRAAAVEAAVETVGLAGERERVVGRLSGGQRARVSLATALLGAPDVFVLDEPTVGLDPVLRRDLWDAFHALAADGRTLLVSSHVMDEAERCDRLLLLYDGRILATGTPEDLRRNAGAGNLDEAFLRLVEGA